MAAFLAWLTRRDNATVLTSATFWVNLLTIGGTLLSYVSGILPPEYLPWATAIGGILNAVLVVLKKLQPPAPTPDPNAPPEPSPAPEFPVLVWLRDILIALANKEIIAPAELKTLGVKLVEAELSKAEAQGSEPIPVPTDELQKAIQVLHSRGINL